MNRDSASHNLELARSSAEAAAPSLPGLADTMPYPAGWAVDPQGRSIPAAWAVAQWRRFWPPARRVIERAAAAVPPEHQDLALSAVRALIFDADCRRDDNGDWFGRYGWPADDEDPQLLGEWALEEMARAVVPEADCHSREFAAARELLADLERSCPRFRAEMLKLASAVHWYGNPRIWVTPGDHQATLHSAQAYFALPPAPWMADDDGRLCVFHEGRPERVSAEELIVQLDAAGVVRELRHLPPLNLHLLAGLEYPWIAEYRALLPQAAARLIVACHEWPHLPRLSDIVSSATADVLAAWRAAYGDGWVTSAKIAALGVSGIPGDPVLLGRMLGTLAERELAQRGKRTSAGYEWRLTCGETV